MITKTLKNDANQSFDYDTFTNSAITIGLPKKPTYGVRMNFDF